MKYIHYNESSGEILGFFDKDIHDNIPEPNIEITDEEWGRIRKEGIRFLDIETKQFKSPDYKPIDQKKAEKKYYIDGCFSNNCSKNIIYSVRGVSYEFQADKRSIDSILRALVFLGGEQEITWYDVDNAPVTLNKTELKGLLDSILEREQQLVQKKMELKQKIKDALSVEELDEIVW